MLPLLNSYTVEYISHFIIYRSKFIWQVVMVYHTIINLQAMLRRFFVFVIWCTLRKVHLYQNFLVEI
jgi:hypothetical protein